MNEIVPTPAKDMTPKAAKSLLYRARNQLRMTLTAYVTETE